MILNLLTQQHLHSTIFKIKQLAIVSSSKSMKNLHSTIFKIKLHQPNWKINLRIYLHSTIFKIKPSQNQEEYIRHLKFTFYYI